MKIPKTREIIIIIVALILLAYVFYDYIIRVKWSVKEGMKSDEPFYNEVSKEIGYKEIDAKELPSGINNMPASSQDMELMQYCVKGSANSAYSGQYISDEMVKYVLSRGCRFLDFEVYYLPIGDGEDEKDTFAPYVGYSSDPSSVNSTTKNNYLFRKVLKSTLSNAFTQQSGEKYESPNPKDPLFVHIRIKTDNKTKDKLYDMIQADIQSVFNSGYNDYFLVKRKNDVIIPTQVDGTTPIKRLAQKVVMIFDYEPDKVIGSFHNMTSDSSQLVRMTYDEVNTFKYKAMPPKRLDSSRTDINKLKMAVPDSNRSDQENPDIHGAIKNYGVQFTLIQYYNTDMNLILAESMFQQYSAAILPMSLLLNYIKNSGVSVSREVSPKLFAT